MFSDAAEYMDILLAMFAASGVTPQKDGSRLVKPSSITDRVFPTCISTDCVILEPTFNVVIRSQSKGVVYCVVYRGNRRALVRVD